MWPEDHDPSARLQHAVKLRENLLDLCTREMLEDPEVVDAVEGCRRKREIEYVSVADPEGGRVVTLVHSQRRWRDVHGRDLHAALKRHVDLTAAASSVKEVCAIRKVPEHGPLELRLYHRHPIKLGDGRVSHRRGAVLLVPVRIPALRVNQR